MSVMTTTTTTRARRRRAWHKVRLYAALLVGAIFAAGPVLWMLSSSFKSNADIFEYPPKLIDNSFSAGAFNAVFDNPEAIRFFVNSYVVGLSVTALTIVVAILAAFALSRFRFFLREPLKVMIIGVQAIPPITLIIPLFGLVVTLHLYNSYEGLILTYLVFTLPYSVIMMTAYFNSIPRELDEAARIDGAGTMRTLWRVIVPLARPGLVAVGFYAFMISWNEFLFALTLTQTDNMRTVPVGLTLLMGQYNYQWNQIMAMSVLGCLPVVILFLLFQRHFVSGLSSGSLKG
jgi:multiple sugar transport system permease protein